MSPWNNQLIILGNGFDLECQLRSQFDDYFQTRMEKPWLCEPYAQWKENPDDPEIYGIISSPSKKRIIRRAGKM